MRNQSDRINGDAWGLTFSTLQPSVTTPKPCDTLIDQYSGNVYEYSGTGWEQRGQFCMAGPSGCPCAVASLPANAAQIGYDCGSKCFYVVPSTAKDAAGNTLAYDSFRKTWGYIEWATWTTTAPGTPEAVQWPAPNTFDPFFVTGTLGPSQITANLQHPQSRFFFPHL